LARGFLTLFLDAPMHAVFTRRQLWLLVALTLTWGNNWPMLKLGVTHYEPLTFRLLSMMIGLPLLGVVLYVRGIPFRVPRHEWRELLVLAFFNMLVWHALIIFAVKDLSSGRAGIIGYTMPVFSAVFGYLWFGTRLHRWGWIGLLCAAAGVTLLLWHELESISGKPMGVALGLLSACAWGIGTQLTRHTRMSVHTMTLSFWSTVVCVIWMFILALCLEPFPWREPPAITWVAILYNALGIFVFAQTVWLLLARSLPPLASTLSVMFIPVLGVFSGAYWLGEVLHWQDLAAIVLIVLAIAAVLWPVKRQTA
jgi:drug/metabolite transporter (DMT)-like permease